MRAAAFFDLDSTVLRIDTGRSWVKFQVARGAMGRRDRAQSLYWSLLYKAAVLDIETLATRLVAGLAGQAEAEMVEACAIWQAQDVLPQIAGPARAAIARHLAAGDVVALLTGATQYAAEPVAAHLGVPHVLSTRLEVGGGRFTGRLAVRGFADHKVGLAEQFAAVHDVDLGRSAFYTDSYTDLKMLERVGTPVAINPDPRLARHARARGWLAQQWR